MFGTTWIALSFVFLLASCDGDDVGKIGFLVGGPCSSENDCDPDSACLQGDKYPGGMCALPCALQRHCPDGSSCVKMSGTTGFCLQSCTVNLDCRDSYECSGVDRIGEDGQALVCKGVKDDS